MLAHFQTTMAGGDEESRSPVLDQCHLYDRSQTGATLRQQRKAATSTQQAGQSP